MAKTTINTRIIYGDKPGEVTGIRKGSDGAWIYEITLDEDSKIIGGLSGVVLKREDGKKLKVILSKPKSNSPTLKSLLRTCEKNAKEYKGLKKAMQKKGLENLNMEETEKYGCYVGKYEILIVMIKGLKEIKDAKK